LKDHQNEIIPFARIRYRSDVAVAMKKRRKKAQYSLDVLVSPLQITLHLLCIRKASRNSRSRFRKTSLSLCAHFLDFALLAVHFPRSAIPSVSCPAKRGLVKGGGTVAFQTRMEIELNETYALTCVRSVRSNLSGSKDIALNLSET
jgi:hypothetical protein